MGFSRQEHWSRLPFPPIGDFLDPGIKPTSLMFPALADGFFTTKATWEALPLDTFIATLCFSPQPHLACLHANVHLSILLVFFAQAFLYFRTFAHPVALLEMWTASRSTHSLGFSFQLDPPGLFWLILL